MRDVTLVILNSLRIKCHIRRPLKDQNAWDSIYPGHNYQSIRGVTVPHNEMSDSLLT